MVKIIFIRHLRTKIDKTKPVAEWELEKGFSDIMIDILNRPSIKNAKAVYSSPENKAKITALVISKEYGLDFFEDDLLAEVDRSRSGFIEGDYEEVVRTYFEDLDFLYKWESIENVWKRINCFLESVKNFERDFVVVSHGMFLSILLSRYFDKNIVEFWKNLGFGEVIEVELDLLLRKWGV